MTDGALRRSTQIGVPQASGGWCLRAVDGPESLRSRVNGVVFKDPKIHSSLDVEILALARGLADCWPKLMQ